MKEYEAGHPDSTDLMRDFSPGNSDVMYILTLGLGLGLGLRRVLGLELGHQDVPGLKNTGVNFLASDRSRQDVADPKEYVGPISASSNSASFKELSQGWQKNNCVCSQFDQNTPLPQI